jgi:predicted nucleic acid-binding protein
MRDRAAAWVFDTVTLSNFALAGRLDLLISRYGHRAQLTSPVLDEVSEGVAAGYPALRVIEEAVAAGELGCAGPLTPDERLTYRGLLRSLSPGEASCIVCAEKRGGVVVTDDRAARSCCAEHGVKFTGTIGILKALCLDGTIAPAAADSILRSMVDAGYRSPVARVSDFV